MTHPTLTRMAHNRAKLLERVTVLTDDALDQPHGDGWTVRETLTHLLNAEDDHTRVALAIATGRTERIPTELDLDAHNQARLAARGHLTTPELFAALDAQRATTAAAFASLSAAQLDTSGRHPVLGEITVEGIFRVIALHDMLHLRDINAVLGGSGSTSEG